MNEQRFQDAIYIALESIGDSRSDEHWIGTPIASVRSFDDLGVLSDNKGVVVRLEDGSEFQLTIVKSR